MSLLKILSQKIRNPKDNTWIETSYIEQDDTEENASPVIYMRGKLADDRVVEDRNLAQNSVGAFQLIDGSVSLDKLDNDARSKVNKGILTVT